MNQALDNFLGLVSRSNKIVFGVDNLKQLRPQRIKHILIVTSASEKTKANVEDFADHHQLLYSYLDPSEVPHFMDGKNIACIAVIDSNIALKITNLMKEGETYE